MITIRYKNLSIPLLFLICSLMVNMLVLSPIYSRVKQTPPGTQYAYAEGFVLDYYAYVAWIKRGMNGQILVTSPYTQESQTPVLFHPLYPMLGMLAKIGTISQFEAYVLARLVATNLLLLLLYHLMGTVLVTKSRMLWSAIFLLTSGTFWYPIVKAGTLSIIEPLSWSTNFNVVQKFYLPPHHLFAIVSILYSLILLFRDKNSPQILTTSIILGLIAGLFNPAIVTWILFSLAILFLAQLIKNRFRFDPMTKKILIYTSTVSLAVLYHMFIFTHVYPWTRLYELTKAFNPKVTLVEYITALGPLFLFSLPVLFLTSIRTKTTMQFLMIWAYLPVVLFSFIGNIIPLNYTKLFQSYQWIPLSLLAGISIDAIIKKFSGLPRFRFVPYLIMVLYILYTIFPIPYTLAKIQTQILPNHYNAYIPLPAVNALIYLDEQSPKDSVVLAGEYISNLIPAFTHNRVILGRDDAATDYYVKRERANEFLQGTMNQSAAQQFLTDYSISSILFGIDSKPYSVLPLHNYPFLQESFRDGSVSVVTVAL